MTPSDQASVREAALREAAAALCNGCKSGNAPSLNPDADRGKRLLWHDLGTPRAAICAARVIWELIGHPAPDLPSDALISVASAGNGEHLAMLCPTCETICSLVLRHDGRVEWSCGTLDCGFTSPLALLAAPRTGNPEMKYTLCN